MGNTPSNQNGSADASGNATPSGNNASSSTNLPGSSSLSAPQNIAGTGTTVRSGTAPAFHSGITPPARTPSPPPPSTPPLLPYAGHLSPQNPHALSLPQAHDYSKTIVTGLIMEAKLAPFYRGLEDFEEDWNEDDIAKILNEVREQDLEEGVANSVTERLKEEKEAASGIGSVTKKMIHRNKDARREEESLERERRERRAYIGAVECPICFLNYPSNINTSRCCQQPICTECFVQMKRGEATLTHLESEPSTCPFCVETEFGVIYERPISAMTPAMQSSSALAISPEAGTSGFSQAMSTHSEEVELGVGPGMAPKAQEKMRRKSVSSKSAEVVTIDQIRPDWERKLNAVKAAAARRASRRIVMRQVGDRLVPIGFTSARAPGTADFSMSTGAAAAATPDENGSRRSRRGTAGREREMEEVMIMEAMRLSMIDHEDHQKKMHDQAMGNNGGSGTATPNSTNTNEASSSRVILSGPMAGTTTSAPPVKEKGEGKAQKFLSSIRNKNRSRSDSAASNKSSKSVSFSTGTSAGVSPGLVPSRNSGSSSPTSSSPVVTAKSPPTTSNLKPASASPVAPVTTLADHRSIEGDVPAAESSTAPVGSIPRISMDLPGRISMDMKPMEPTPPKNRSTHVEQSRDDELETPVHPTYARLNSEV